MPQLHKLSTFLGRPGTFALLITVMFFCFKGNARAEVEISAATGVMTGYTQYEIGGPVYNSGPDDPQHFPLSRLKFPTNAAMLRGKVKGEIWERWQIEGSVSTNLTEEAGDMKDYDWGHPDYSGDPETLDIYSKSDSEIRTYSFDLQLSYSFLENQLAGRKPFENWFLEPSVGIGFRYQYFDFNISDTTQWDNVSESANMFQYSGSTLTYEAEYLIPYLSTGVVITAPHQLSFNLWLAWAPAINFRDWDNHLLRNKTQEADHHWNGSAYLTTISCRYDFSRNWFAQSDLEASYLESKGRAVQSTGQSVKHEVESRQTSAYLAIGYRF